MKKRVCVQATGTMLFAAWLAQGCGGGTTDPPKATPCSGPVTVTVTMADTVPVFSWEPECTIGRLLVLQGLDEYWGTETCGDNTYTTPIRYSINPPNTCPEEFARPLEHGLTYTVELWSFFSKTADAESLQLRGTTNFTY